MNIYIFKLTRNHSNAKNVPSKIKKMCPLYNKIGPILYILKSKDIGTVIYVIRVL